MGNLIFAIISFLIACYLYYEFLKEGLLARLWLFGSLLGILSFCLGLGRGNQIGWLNGITVLICAFSLEENTVFLIRKLKAKKGKKKNIQQINDL